MKDNASWVRRILGNGWCNLAEGVDIIHKVLITDDTAPEAGV